MSEWTDTSHPQSPFEQQVSAAGEQRYRLRGASDWINGPTQPKHVIYAAALDGLIADLGANIPDGYTIGLHIARGAWRVDLRNADGAVAITADIGDTPLDDLREALLTAEQHAAGG